MKNFCFILILLSISEIIKCQDIIINNFDNGLNLDSSWEFNLGGTYSSATNSGENIPSAKFSATGHFLKTPFCSSYTDLNFWLKGISVDTLSSFVIYAYDGNYYLILDSITRIPTKGTNFHYELPNKTIQVMFKYYRSQGNLAFDDLKIWKPSMPPIIDHIELKKILDYTANIDIECSHQGQIIYLVTENSCIYPTINELLDLKKYSNSLCIVDSGTLLTDTNGKVILYLTSLSPHNSYNLHLLPTGNKKNISDTSKIYSLNFSTIDPQPDLFFKFICKNSSKNKAIALYNPTNDTINLNNYRIAMSTNGGGWNTSYFYFNKGNTKLPPHKKYVIIKSKSDTSFINQCKSDTLTSSSVLSFTGNDARALQKTFNNGKTWVNIDVYGNPNSSEIFNIAGVSAAASSYNLLRKSSIFIGNANWNVSAGQDSETSEWLLLPTNDYTYILKPKYKLKFISLKFKDQIENPKFDDVSKIIYVKIDKNADLSHLQWTYDYDPEITVSPNPQEIVDFNKPVNFLFATADSMQQMQWTIKVLKDTNVANYSLRPNYIDIDVFPNPFKDKLFIHSHSVLIKSIELIDNKGVSFATNFKIPREIVEINTTDLYSGIYIFIIYLDNNQIFVKKMIKAK